MILSFIQCHAFVMDDVNGKVLALSGDKSLLDQLRMRSQWI